MIEGDNKSDICVILCMYYPYTDKEHFIHMELPYIAARFRKVIVIPVAVTPADTKTYEMPSNVQCLPMQQGNGIKLKSEAVKVFFRHMRFFMKHARDKKSDLKYFALAAAVCRHLQDSLPVKKMILHSFWFDYTVMAGLLFRKYNSQVKITTQAHGYDLYEYRNKLGYLPFRNYMMSKIEAVYPCSKDGAKYLGRKYGKVNANIKTAYLGTVGPEKRPPVQKDESVFRIVTCSYLVEVKRIDRLIDALAVLDKKCDRKIVWDCIGDGELFERLEKKAGNIISCIEVNFLGEMTNAEVLNYYLTHYIDVFVNTSESEGLPVSIMEAMSYWIPVIAPNVGGIQEIIDNGINGILLSRKCTTPELARAISFMMDMEAEKMEYYKINARLKWEKMFDAVKNFNWLADELKGISTL